MAYASPAAIADEVQAQGYSFYPLRRDQQLAASRRADPMPQLWRPSALAAWSRRARERRRRSIADRELEERHRTSARYRIVDFVLSNLVNSNINTIYLLVQYKSQSLIEHVRKAWTISGKSSRWPCPTSNPAAACCWNTVMIKKPP